MGHFDADMRLIAASLAGLFRFLTEISFLLFSYQNPLFCCCERSAATDRLRQTCRDGPAATDRLRQTADAVSDTEPIYFSYQYR